MEIKEMEFVAEKSKNYFVVIIYLFKVYMNFACEWPKLYYTYNLDIWAHLSKITQFVSFRFVFFSFISH